MTFIKSRTARIFWDNGYKSVGAVATANVDDLIPILLLVTGPSLPDRVEAATDDRLSVQAQNKKLRLHPDNDQKYHQKLLLKAEMIVKSATRIWGESFDYT